MGSVAMVIGMACLPVVAGRLVINEVMPVDAAVQADEDGDYPGWVEILNQSGGNVDLGGLGLSDDPQKPFRWVFPHLTLPPQGSTLVFLSGKNRRLPPSDPIVGTNTPLAPDRVAGLRFWLDAADAQTVALVDGRVAAWKDKSQTTVPASTNAPLRPDQVEGVCLWLDAADTASLSAVGGRVARWADKSGRGNDAVQHVPDCQPWLDTSAPSRLPALRFDGQTNFLRFPRLTSVQSVFWVVAEDPDASSIFRALLGDDTAYDFHRGDRGEIYRAFRMVWAGVAGLSTTWLDGSLVDPTAVLLPPRTVFVATLSDRALTAATISWDQQVPGRLWQGQVAEVVAYERRLSEAERAGVQAYLIAKWQLPVPPLATRCDAAQAAPARRPGYGVSPLTGWPAVGFDGQGQGLEFPRLDGIRSVFWVGRADPQAASNYRPILGDSYYYDFHGGNDRLLFSLTHVNPAVMGGKCRIDGQPVDAGVARLPASWAWLSLVTTNACRANNLAWYPNRLDRSFAGEVGEVIVYDRPLEDAERAGVEAYLQQKWRLPPHALHASFTLAAAGGPLILTAPNGMEVDRLIVPGVPDGVSFGRPTGSAEAASLYLVPTPGQPNPAVGWTRVSDEPVVWPDAGSYWESMTVVVNTNGLGGPVYYTLDGTEPAAPTASPEDQVWMDDTLLEGSVARVTGGDDWSFVQVPAPFMGERSHRSVSAPGFHSHGFVDAPYPLVPTIGDTLFTYVLLDPADMPEALALEWQADAQPRRVFWGQDRFEWGTVGSPSNCYGGPLPAPGRWTRLEVPAAALRLEDRAIRGVHFMLCNGRAWWDATGRSSTNLTRSRVYTGPLVFTNTVVFRARAVASNGLPSRTVTRTYLVDFPTSLPVVSLSLDPHEVYSEQRGLLALGARASRFQPFVGANFWNVWEKPCHFELFDRPRGNGLGQALGLGVHGNWSRSAPQKSLAVHARKRYGAGKINYPVFRDLSLDTFDELVLRNSGNDWNGAFMRDAVLQGLTAGLPLGQQAAQPAHVFLNGQYYGLLDIRENANPDYLTAHYGVAADDLDAIFRNAVVQAGDLADYSGLLQYVRAHDLADAANYSIVTNWIDLDNYLDCQIVQIYTDNRDWPGNNVLAWRRRSTNGPWRWVLNNLDSSFEMRDEGPARDTMAAATSLEVSGPAAMEDVQMFIALLANSDFRARFLSRFAEQLNTRFQPETVIAQIDAAEALRLPEMSKHIERWLGYTNFDWPALPSLETWRANVDEMRAFARLRPAYVWQFLERYFDLSGRATLQVGVVPANGGFLKLDRLTLGSGDLPWSGVYFHQVPVTVQAVPSAGFRFLGWQGASGTNSTVQVALTNDATLVAFFASDEDYNLDQLRPRPFDLRSRDYELLAFPADTPARTYPSNMLFYQSAVKDPALDAPMETEWTLPYDRSSRSRVRGLGSLGVSFINTSDPQPEPGSGHLGAAVLALQTTGLANIQVSWTGGTVQPNNRSYGIRLRYRIGTTGPFRDVEQPSGQPIEYVRSDIVGDLRLFGPVTLPPDANNQTVVQLQWRYYFIPTGATGPRAELRVDDIRVWPGGGRVPLALLSLKRMRGPALAAQYAAIPGESVELLQSTDLRSWTVAALLRADQEGVILFRTDIPTTDPARFYQLKRLVLPGSPGE